MPWMVAGGFFFLLGTLFLFFASRQRARLEAILQARPWTASELAATPPPPGSLIRVQGKVVCELPLESFLAHLPCVFFSSRIVERVEEVSYQTNRRTNLEERVARTYNQALDEQTDRTPFRIDDGSGQILVDPTGAEVDGSTSIDRFQPTGAALPPPAVPVPGSETPHPDAGKRVLGVHHTETILAVDQAIWALGAFFAQGNEPGLARPSSNTALFLISRKSWEEQAKTISGGVKLLTWAGGGSCALGLASFLLGFR